jgi:hypothetical protein
MADDKEGLVSEEIKIRKLRRTVDLTTALLYQADLTLESAQRLIASCKKSALELFPDKEETFELIYGSRFRRILTERFQLQ